MLVSVEHFSAKELPEITGLTLKRPSKMAVAIIVCAPPPSLSLHLIRKYSSPTILCLNSLLGMCRKNVKKICSLGCVVYLYAMNIFVKPVKFVNGYIGFGLLGVNWFNSLWPIADISAHAGFIFLTIVDISAQLALFDNHHQIALLELTR